MTDNERSATDWLAAFADQLGVDPPSEETVNTLLELAGIAAHNSERIAAPIACWLVGQVAMSPAEAMAVASGVSGAD